MPAATIPVSPPDIATILTSLGIFSLAIAAVVGGIYKGIKEVKQGGADTGKSVSSALIMDHSSLVRLTDSNDRLVASNAEMLSALRQIDRSIERLIEVTSDARETTRGGIEEQHRLRAAVADLVEMMRRVQLWRAN